MSTHRAFDRICAVSIVIAILFSLFLWYCVSSYGAASDGKPGYEDRLFDTSKVHVIDIVMDDWDTFISNCENEEYSDCVVIIDGDRMKNVAIRAKGNTSLSSVRSMGSQRYSFKLEFDHYQKGRTYHGLDKLCLNNLIQDNTMMKDYLAYRMMAEFGVDAPLCSFAYIRVNGEDWGLYLAVEGIEDSFLARNYGNVQGNLYKPDSMSFGGGRGNGRDFKMDDFDFSSLFDTDSGSGYDFSNIPGGMQMPDQGGGFPGGFSIPGGMQMPSGGFGPQSGSDQSSEQKNRTGEDTPGDGQSRQRGNRDWQIGDSFGNGFSGMQRGGQGMNFGGFGFGSSDVKLQYIDDDPASYSNIFENAKTKITDEDKERLIASLKKLNEYTAIEDVVDVDEVMRYFAVHNFICNEDSYTGMMVHNYYLYEENGRLSMIPWDYNLGFGTFTGGNASGTVNASIDSPVSNGTVNDRPMLGWIFSSEEYLNAYHETMGEFIDQWFTNGYLTRVIDETAEMIRPYVESDPTKFCSVEEFNAGVECIRSFVTLRAESVSRQLQGNTEKVDTGDLNLSVMGTMNSGGQRVGNGFSTRPDSKPDGAGMKDGFTFPDTGVPASPGVPGTDSEKSEDRNLETGEDSALPGGFVNDGGFVFPEGVDMNFGGTGNPDKNMPPDQMTPPDTGMFPGNIDGLPEWNGSNPFNSPMATEDTEHMEGELPPDEIPAGSTGF